MSFLEDKCSLFPVVTSEEMEGFTCGDHDLDEFFTNDCFAYSKELLGKTYCFKMDENSQTVVCAFTLANAGVRVTDLPNARKKKIEANIPHVKSLKDYPAVLVARLGVSKDFRSLHIGSDVLSYIGTGDGSMSWSWLLSSGWTAYGQISITHYEEGESPNTEPYPGYLGYPTCVDEVVI